MKYRKLIITTFLVVMMFFVVNGCKSATTPSPTATQLSPTQTSVPPTATPIPPTPTTEPTATPIPPTEVPNYSEKVDVGGYKLYIKCIGEGIPTVILEGPMGTDQTIWRNVLAENPTNLGVRVCVYDRAGQGYSEASPKRPRTSQDMVEDLHTLLTNASITSPSVYVGYGQGAFNARLYRELYPDEVVGLILIEGGDTDFSVLDHLPPETENEHPSVAKIREYFTYMETPKYAPETYDIKASQELLQSAAPLGDLPLVVLSRDPVNRQAQLDLWFQAYGSDTPLDVLNAIEDGLADSMTKVAALSSNSIQIFVEEGPYIARNSPERVIEAIRIILEQVQ
ncbi:MAG: alpha/beta hydrolase [Anaerolineae bacterium]|nr:alpha/beta hydrolase [Anaerolineae bacterium]